MFATPVPGYLHPEGWVRPAGNLDFVVTRGCAAHLRTGVGCALDIGNARQGAPVYAMAAGKVTSRYIQNTPGQVGHGALIMRVTHAGRLDTGGYWSTGYAHLQSFSVPMGAIVSKGQQIGVLGATGYGISGPHLHTDCKQHTSQFPNGVAKDLWPLLDQTILTAGASEVILGSNPQRLINKKASTKLAGANFRRDPSIANPALTQFPAGTVFYPDFQVGGANVNGSTVWYTGALWTGSKQERGYFHVSTLTPLEAAETVPGPSDCADEIAAATAPLKARLDDLTVIVAAQNQKIGNAKAALG